MSRKISLYVIVVCSFLFSCATSKNYSPSKKFPKALLESDYRLLRKILEKKHPSLYWYTAKDSMDFYFEKYYGAISDSMTEQQFTWQVLSPLIDKIHCGHTSVGSSKGYRNWVVDKRFPSFPLYLKVWNDTMAVINNLNRKDSIFKRGTLVTSINGLSNLQQINKMFDYLPEDGYANNVNYIRLSGNFPYYHRNIFGLSKKYALTYIDAGGMEQKAELPLFTPVKDTSKRTVQEKRPAPPKENRLRVYRSMVIDSSALMATITLNTFSKGKLHTFFRKSFRELHQKKVKNLVIDLRSNGGGKVAASTLLTKYISRKPFKVADSVYATARGLGSYARFIKGKWFNNLEMFFISRKRKDGKYHLGLLERKLYKPKIKNHFNERVFVVTSGPTFSASALFCNVVKGQPGITLLGEETGGGWYGNSGIIIPDIRLPNTKATVRLPLFRLVQYKHVLQKGAGIPPDIFVGTNYPALIKGTDYKMQVIREMILKGK
jgi:hypothetical protein